MVDCKSCKEKVKAEKYKAEAVTASLSRANTRLWILCIILIVALIGTNALWIYHEMQYEDVVIEAEQDGSGYNLVGGGDINYGTEG